MRLFADCIRRPPADIRERYKLRQIPQNSCFCMRKSGILREIFTGIQPPQPAERLSKGALERFPQSLLGAETLRKIFGFFAFFWINVKFFLKFLKF